MVSINTFSTVLSRLTIPQTSSVGVAVSGGSDSIALLYLATKVFQNVLGITVDHQIRPESRDEAIKAGDIVRRLGADHELVTLKWPEGFPTHGRIQTACRDKRYQSLLDVCAERNLKVLLIGHHQNDQLETVMYRLARNSRFDGLAGILPVVQFDYNPHVTICRPLLDFNKDSLRQVCTDNKLTWIEDPTNSHPVFWRNVIRQVMDNYPHLQEGIVDFSKTCADARRKAENEVHQALDKGTKINKEYGHVLIDYNTFFQLSRPVALRLLQVIMQYVTGTFKSFRSKTMNQLYNYFEDDRMTRNFNIANCIVFPVNENCFCVARHRPPKIERENPSYLTPIKIGEMVHWDNRFNITLSCLSQGHQLSNKKPNYSPQTFYIRHLLDQDNQLFHKGVRKIRSIKLPHVLIRGGLPVIVDDSDHVVLIPHFKVIDKSYGITCKCNFKQKRTLKECIKLQPIN